MSAATGPAGAPSAAAGAGTTTGAGTTAVPGLNLATILEGAPDEAVAIVDRGRRVTYAELRREVAAIRGGLAERGVGDGDRVALVLGTALAFPEVLLAVVGLGAVAVPLNPTSPAAELAREAAAVDATAVVADAAGAAAWAAIPAEDIPSVRLVVTPDGPTTLEELLQGPERAPVPVAGDHLAALMFTSGTAGAPRAAMLTHRNITANVTQSLSSPDRIHPGDVVLGVLPLHHIFGLTVALCLTLQAGATVVLEERFDPMGALSLVKDEGVTIIPGAPPMWAVWADLPDVPAAAFTGVRHALSGAAKLPEEIWETMEERFGLALREGYGLTEASPVVTTSAGIEPRPGSIGKALAGVEVRLVDSNGDDALEGDPGEIWVRGPNVFGGYWHDAEATARVLTPDGWLRTGDVAVADADGYLYLVDRAKDLVIVSGFNVYPAEVEDALRSLPEVTDVAVVGVPDARSGEAVKAFVVRAAGSDLDESAVRSGCGTVLARYKCPTIVEFVDRLPYNAAGKLLRRELH